MASPSDALAACLDFVEFGQISFGQNLGKMSKHLFLSDRAKNFLINCVIDVLIINFSRILMIIL